MSEGDVIDAKEVSTILRLHIKTVYTLSREGKLPAIRIGRSYRYSRKNILDMLNPDAPSFSSFKTAVNQ